MCTHTHTHIDKQSVSRNEQTDDGSIDELTDVENPGINPRHVNRQRMRVGVDFCSVWCAEVLQLPSLDVEQPQVENADLKSKL